MLLQYVFLKDLSKTPKLSYSHFVLLSLSQGKKLNFPHFSVNLVTCKSLTLQLPSETGLARALPQCCSFHTGCWHFAEIVLYHNPKMMTLDSIQSPQTVTAWCQLSKSIHLGRHHPFHFTNFEIQNIIWICTSIAWIDL